MMEVTQEQVREIIKMIEKEEETSKFQVLEEEF